MDVNVIPLPHFISHPTPEQSHFLTLQFTLAAMLPNKALWVTLHLIMVDTVQSWEEYAVVGVCKSILAVLEKEFLAVRHQVSFSWP